MARVAIPGIGSRNCWVRAIDAGFDEDAVTRIRSLLVEVLEEVNGEEAGGKESSGRETAAAVNRPA
jgi:hypothetical protein